MVVTDLLAKNPEDRPPNARAVAVRLGLADHEIAGLAIGLARTVYGDGDEPDEAVTQLSRALLDPSPTMAADDEPSPRACGTTLSQVRRSPGGCSPSAANAVRIARTTRCDPSRGTAPAPAPRTSTTSPSAS